MAVDRRLRALDGVRALAIVAVLAVHAGIPFLPGGFIGVDLFFVLSGFLITSLLHGELAATGRIRLGGFWTRRARRLLPAALVMIVAVLAARPLFAPDSVAALRGDAVAAALWSANWRWALQGTDYFVHGGTPSPLQHTWSLAVEEQFYLIWPLLLLACAAVRRRLLGLSLAGVAVSAVATYVLARVASPGRVYFGTDVRAQELLAGAALAALLAPTWRWRAGTPAGQRSPQPAARQPVPLLLSVCGLAALTGIATTADGAPSEFRHGLLLVTALAAAALVAGVVLDTGHPVARLLSARPLAGIGRISYGLYLWHWPVYLALDGERTGLHGYPLAVLRLAVTGALAGASFVLIERPAQRVQVRPRRVLPAAAAGVAAVVLIAVSTAPAGAPQVTVAPALAAGPDAPPHVLARPVPRPLAAVPPTPGRHGPLTVAVFGDSIAWTLMRYLPPTPGIRFFDHTVLGCGIITGGPYRYFGAQYSGDRTCDAWPWRWRRQLRADRPDEVLLLVGRWETMDHYYQGRWRHVGDSSYNRHLAVLLGEAITLLGSAGARVVVATEPYNRRGEQPDGSLYPEDLPVRVTDWNRLLRSVAAAHPGTEVLDLNRKLCPDGMFTWSVDGIQVRSDGVHLTPAGVQWLTPWLLRQLYQDAHG